MQKTLHGPPHSCLWLCVTQEHPTRPTVERDVAIYCLHTAVSHTHTYECTKQYTTYKYIPYKLASPSWIFYACWWSKKGSTSSVQPFPNPSSPETWGYLSCCSRFLSRCCVPRSALGERQNNQSSKYRSQPSGQVYLRLLQYVHRPSYIWDWDRSRDTPTEHGVPLINIRETVDPEFDSKWIYVGYFLVPRWLQCVPPIPRKCFGQEATFWADCSRLSDLCFAVPTKASPAPPPLRRSSRQHLSIMRGHRC